MPSRGLLLFDTDRAVHESISDLLRRETRPFLHAYDAVEALECFRRRPCDVVVAGQGSNGGAEGLRLLRGIRLVKPETRVILTGDSGPARVLGALRAHAYSYFHKPIPASGLADMVRQALECPAWRDDLRVISARPDWLTLMVRCKLEAVERAIQFVREMLAELPAPMREDIAAAFRELLLNATEHGCRLDPKRRVRASLRQGERFVMGEIEDHGKGFSMEELSHAAIANPSGDPTRHVEIREEKGQRPGGFGILMARHLVDELLYNQRGNGVLFVKYRT